MHNHQKKIAVINDFCGFGKCSIAVSLPIISAMKIQCCPLPTSLFSNHTGFESFYFNDFTDNMPAYINEWEKLNLRFEGILSGYLGSVNQIDIVKNFFKKFKTDKTIIVVDPVMGDNGKLYAAYSSELAKKMRELLEFADIITPNLTEACILTDTEFNPALDDDEILKICEKLSEMGPEKIVVSGIERGEDLENFIFEKNKPYQVIREHKVGICRAGTGDVFSSMISADAVKGIPFAKSVQHASVFIGRVLRKTVELDIPTTDGVCFEEFLPEINSILGD